MHRFLRSNNCNEEFQEHISNSITFAPGNSKWFISLINVFLKMIRTKWPSGPGQSEGLALINNSSTR